MYSRKLGHESSRACSPAIFFCPADASLTFFFFNSFLSLPHWASAAAFAKPLNLGVSGGTDAVWGLG